MAAAVVVIVVLLVRLPLGAALVAPRLRPARPHPRTGTGDRVWALTRDTDGPQLTRPPDGVTPAELGALVLPDAHYQQVTATVLDLAARGHLAITLLSAPTTDRGTAWWELALTDTGGGGVRSAAEDVVLHVVGVLDGPVRFPNLTNGATDRAARALHRHPSRASTQDAVALQRGIARHPEHVDAQTFAHAVALDVSPALTRSLTSRGEPTPGWAATRCPHPVTWALLEHLALDGSPLLPRSLHQAGFQGGV